jgi:hypothetical protein
LILHAATWCHSANAGNTVESPVAAMRTLIPADAGDVRPEQGRCKISPIGFAIHHYHHRLSGDGRRAADQEFPEQIRRIGMSTEGGKRA